MRKFLLTLFIIFGFVLADSPIVGNAYVISALGIKNTSDGVSYISGDTSVGGNANYVLAPQVIVYQDSLEYVGSYTPFTGCLNSQHYTNGAPDGMCITGIINDLTTGGTDKALSAEQGKVLNEKVSDLQNKTRINYLRPTLQTNTKNGVTLTNNGDGTYTLDGTATGNTYFSINPPIALNPGIYKVLGTPAGGSNSSYGFGGKFTDTFKVDNETGNGIIFTVDSKTALDEDGFIIFAMNGKTYNNVIFKPMLTNDLNATYDDFVPYQDSLAANQTIIDATRINLFKPTLWTTDLNGVRLTNNMDGTYRLNGTATDLTIFDLGTYTLPKGTYKLIGCPDGGSTTTYYLDFRKDDGEQLLDIGGDRFYDVGNILNTNGQSGKKLRIIIGKGVTCNNLIFKPMITTDLNATYDDFISYEKSLAINGNTREPLNAYYYYDIQDTSSAFNALVELRTKTTECFQRGSIIHIKLNDQTGGYHTYLVGSTDWDYFTVLSMSFYNSERRLELYAYNNGTWSKYYINMTKI